jgi:uncharacterized protein YhfF
MPFMDTIPATSFGSTPSLQVRLAALILAGRKRATVWDGNEPNETSPGMLWRVTSLDKDVATIRTISVERRRFCDIDDDFAYLEGEGDRSLLYWQLVHEQFFRENSSFSKEMWLWCERFELVDIIDKNLALEAHTHIIQEETEAKEIINKALAL